MNEDAGLQDIYYTVYYGNACTMINDSSISNACLNYLENNFPLVSRDERKSGLIKCYYLGIV